MYVYNAKVVRVIDGDTIDVIIDLGFSVFVKQRLRLESVNTAELRGETDPARKASALAAKKFVEEQLLNEDVTIWTDKTDKYDRYIAWVWFGHNNDMKGSTISHMLVENGFSEWVEY